MRSVLQKAGFSVSILENANKKELIKAIRRFESILRNSDAALFYFSGHGAQHDGESYLLPTAPEILNEMDLKHRALPLSMVLDSMHGSGSPARVNIVVVDACRTKIQRSTRGSLRSVPPRGFSVSTFGETTRR